MFNTRSWQVTQRFKDRWRNKIASSAQSILISFFESEPELADSDDARAAYAEWALENSRFCFLKADYDNPKVCVGTSPSLKRVCLGYTQKWRGLFHGNLAILSFASHWECVRGFLDIEELHSDFTDGHSRGALALACSAVSYPFFYHLLANNLDNPGQMKRALLLWKDRAITVNAVQEARGAGCSIKLKARENKSTGKKTTAYAAFSGTHWKDDTNRFLKSAMTLSDEEMDDVTNLAKAATKKVTKTEERASAIPIDDDNDDNDIVLCNGSESPESTHEDGAPVPQWRSRCKFSHFLTCYKSNIVFKLPKQRDR